MSLPTKDGHLFKHRTFPKKWTYRYFKLNRIYLQFYETQHSLDPKGSIVRTDITSVEQCSTFPDRVYVFTIVTKSHDKWHVAASGEEEMEDWIRVLRAHLPPSLSSASKSENKEKLLTKDQDKPTCTRHITILFFIWMGAYPAPGSMHSITIANKCRMFNQLVRVHGSIVLCCRETRLHVDMVTIALGSSVQVDSNLYRILHVILMCKFATPSSSGFDFCGSDLYLLFEIFDLVKICWPLLYYPLPFSTVLTHLYTSLSITPLLPLPFYYTPTPPPLLYVLTPSLLLHPYLPSLCFRIHLASTNCTFPSII